MELARSPTWPASLPTPNAVAPMQPRPNLYLQLSQILEWEIWNHNHTRAQLGEIQERCAHLEGHIWKLEYDLEQWQKTSQTVYEALDEHRAENAKLKADMEVAATTIRYYEQDKVHPSTLAS